MRRLIPILLLLALAGCGYQVPGREDALPEGVTALYLPLFANRTAKPALENGLTDTVAEVLIRNQDVRLVSGVEHADTAAEGTILSYSTTAIAYDQNDKIREYNARMTVEFKLRRVSDGKLLWQNRLTWQEPYLANVDKSIQNDLEDEAIREIDRQLAEEILFRLQSDF